MALPTLGGSAPNRGESALSGSFDMNRLGEMLMEMLNKMDANAQRLDEMRGDMRIQRGEMQNMGLNLQAGQEAMRASMKEVKGKMANEMAPARGGTIEPTGSTNCVRPTMETGGVGMTRDATTIIGETKKLGH